eukprot:1153195-Pelagomonas_calceolata.AAC.6
MKLLSPKPQTAGKHYLACLPWCIQGMISEFRRASRYARAGGIRGSLRDPDMFRREDEDLAILCNGLWALILWPGNGDLGHVSVGSGKIWPCRSEHAANITALSAIASSNCHITAQAKP